MSNFQPIGSFAKVRRGASPRPINNPDFFGGDVGWVRISDVTQRNNKFLKNTQQYLSPLGESRSLRVDAGDLIMSICATVGKPMIVDIPACIHDGFVQIYDIQNVDVEYLYYLLQFKEKDFEKRGQPGTQVNLNTTIVENEIVFIPALLQQQRIAKILGTVDNLIGETQALIEKYTSVKQGMMSDLFTRGIDLSGTPETNGSYGQLRPSFTETPELYQKTELGCVPKDWEINAIEDILNRIIDYRGKTPTKTDSGVPLITAKNVRFGYIDPEPREFIASSDYDSWMTRGIPSQGDVLFTTEAPLANVAQIETEDKVAFAQRMIILQTNTACDSTFLKYLLMSENFRRAIFSRGSGSTVEGVKQSEFKKVKVCLPKSNEEQIQIVQMIDSLTNKIVNEESAISKYKEIKKGLMQDLLTGKVRVN